LYPCDNTPPSQGCVAPVELQSAPLDEFVIIIVLELRISSPAA
jgi:hypothetical protein